MRFLAPLFVLGALLSACSFQPKALLEDFSMEKLTTLLGRDAGPQTIALVGPDHKAVIVTVEIADDPEERAEGLMHREALPENHGMLFLFEEPQELSFWMKNTLIPLDILFFDAAGHCRNIGAYRHYSSPRRRFW